MSSEKPPSAKMSMKSQWILAAILGGAFFFYRSCAGETADEKATRSASEKQEWADQNCSGGYFAYSEAERIVTANLKSPTSAEFPSFSDPGVQVAQKADCHSVVKIYVDADNSFGAKIRSTFLVEMKFDRQVGKWTTVGLLEVD